MPKKTKIVPIKYTDRDFESIKNSLTEHAKRYYPDSYKDFNEASLGSFIVDMAAYVGDVMSFYLDYQTNESFIDTAVEYGNVVKLAKQLGYKTMPRSSSHGVMTLYITVPAASDGSPDANYLPVMKKDTQFFNNAGGKFLLLEDVDFGNTNNQVVVSQVNTTTGQPTSYVVRAYGQVASGELIRDYVDLGNAESLRRVYLASTEIVEVMSVFDAEGHEYFEVEHLSQDTIYKKVLYKSSNSNDPKFLLKAHAVPRRFTVEYDGFKAYLQFGYGSDHDLSNDPITNVSDVVLKKHGKNYVSAATFDPANLLNTDKLGVAPANTTLSIIYRVNHSDNANAAARTIVNIGSPNFEFPTGGLDASKIRTVASSVECVNEEPIVGEVSRPSTSDIKLYAKGNFSSQNRAVTVNDYVNLAYRMPAGFGRVKRCAVQRDRDSLRRNLNIYVTSENRDNNLVATPSAIKENLRVWLGEYKMINDTIDILDAKIVNVGVDFKVLADLNVNKFDVLESCRRNLMRYFIASPFEIGEPLLITEISKVLKDTRGVVDVLNIKLNNKTGGRYSNVYIDLHKNKSSDGRIVLIPEDHIFEVKDPRVDIKGSVR